MILWTIQSITAWIKLQKTGILRAELRYVDKDYISTYMWMAKQMEVRLGFRPSQNSLHLWAWYQWEGGRKKPDLRSSGYLPKGERGVRIKFEIEDSIVVLSDFDLWHYVLNYWYLPATIEEGEAFETGLSKQGLSFYKTKSLPNPAYHKRIVGSWERIFDIEWADEKEFIACREKKKSIQASFWELRMGNVKNIRVFTAK